MASNLTGRRLWRNCRLLAFTFYLSLWIVERTFSWLGQNRRLSKDYEQLCESEEVWIYIAMTRLMARRLPLLSLFQTVSDRADLG